MIAKKYKSEVLNSCISDHEEQAIQIIDNYQNGQFSCVKTNNRVMTEENRSILKALLRPGII